MLVFTKYALYGWAALSAGALLFERFIGTLPEDFFVCYLLATVALFSLALAQRISHQLKEEYD